MPGAPPPPLRAVQDKALRGMPFASPCQRRLPEGGAWNPHGRAGSLATALPWERGPSGPWGAGAVSLVPGQRLSLGAAGARRGLPGAADKAGILVGFSGSVSGSVSVSVSGLSAGCQRAVSGLIQRQREIRRTSEVYG
jgi:hypothetical protein